MNHVLNRSRSGGSFGWLHRCSSVCVPNTASIQLPTRDVRWRGTRSARCGDAPCVAPRIRPKSLAAPSAAIYEMTSKDTRARKTLTAVTVLGIFLLATALFPTGCSRGESSSSSSSSASAHVRELDETSFDAEIQQGVVLVDFWATWCGPCRMQAPIVEQVGAQVEGKAKVAKLDVDKASSVAKKLNIDAIPTLVVFKDGKPHKRFVGLTKADALLSAINAAVDAK